MNDFISGGEIELALPKEELTRIAVALERIADALEQESNGENVENMRMSLNVDAEELAKEILKHHPNA